MIESRRKAFLMIKTAIPIAIRTSAAALLLAAGMLLAEEPAPAPAVTLKALSESRFVHEPFDLQMEVVSDEEIQRPVMADGEGYTVTSISHGFRAPSRPKRLTTFLVKIVASQKGTLTIAPAAVQIGARTFQTEPLRLLVDEPRRAAECRVEITFGATNLYVDQAVVMTVHWQTRTPFIQYQEVVLDLPVLYNQGFIASPLDPDVPEKERIGVPVNAQRVIAQRKTDAQGETLSFKYMLVPQRAALYNFGELRLSCALMKGKQNSNQYPSYFNNNFFAQPEQESRFERVYQSAVIPALRVVPLPEQGRTPLYCGVAGGFNAAAVINPTEVTVGQPMMYEVTLTNMTFGRQIAALPDAVLENTGPAFKLTREPIQESATSDSRKFIYAVRPLRCDVDYVPGLAIQIFDVERREYRMVRTAPLRIAVLPDGDKKVYTPDRGGAESLQERVTGIRGNSQQSVVVMNGYEMIEFVGERAWLFWLLPVVIWLLIRGRVRQMERCRANPEYARAARAWRRFTRQAGEDEEWALREYIADRFGLCAGALTLESCAGELQAHGVAADVVQMVRDYFEAHDAQKYAPAGASVGKRVSIRKMVKAIEKGSSKLLLLALLLMPVLTMAGAPEERFRAAMELRAERADQARPLFVEAALEFESAGSHFNAGNSWFFAGENGRALAAYLAAESRAPFSREIREALAFVRTQRQDDFPAQEGVTAVIASVWRQLCRWDLRLRSGFLTLLYLTAWLIYILARISGRKIDRRIRLGYGALMGIIAITMLYSLMQPARGVVIQSVEARLGPGYAYGAAYASVLHAAVEFEWTAKEGIWVQARLPDDNTVWLHESSCVKVR